MNIETIYQGSPVIVESPTLLDSGSVSDFGLGFYCTRSADLAREWACTRGKSGYVNKYELELDGLEILKIPDSDIGTITWAAMICENRAFRVINKEMDFGLQWLEDKYHVNLSNYDVIEAPRCDDSYFAFLYDFLAGEITLAELTASLKLDTDVYQYVLRSERAVNHLSFVSFAPADSSIFYSRRKNRDLKVRTAYHKMRADKKHSKDLLYLKDIAEQEVTARDLLLR